MLKRNLIPALALLLLAACVPVSEYNQVKQQSLTYQQLNQALQQEIAADQVRISELEGRLKVTIVNHILFPEGGWEINEQGRLELQKIAPALSDLQGKRIEVKGYTDNVPIGHALRARFPSNWELSTARADDVVRYLVRLGVNPQILSATGFGDEQPVASNDTAQGRAQNRRIEIDVLDINTP